LRVSWASRPCPGQRVCGDAVAVLQDEAALLVAVIDGVGHGPEAHAAAEAARRTILESPNERPATLLCRCHEALRGTRGAAVGIVRIDREGRGSFAGVGDVALATRSRSPLCFASHAGIVGLRMRKVVERAFECRSGDLLCVFSDGLTSGLSLNEVDCARLDVWAPTLLERHGRKTDDAALALIAT